MDALLCQAPLFGFELQESIAAIHPASLCDAISLALMEYFVGIFVGQVIIAMNICLNFQITALRIRFLPAPIELIRRHQKTSDDFH